MTDLDYTENTTKGGKKPTKKPEKTVIEESESEESPTTAPSNGPDVISDSTSSSEDEEPEVYTAPKFHEFDSEDGSPAPAEVKMKEKPVHRRNDGRPIRQGVKKPVTYNETALQRSNQGLPPVKKATGKKATTEKKPNTKKPPTAEKSKTKKTSKNPKDVTKKTKGGKADKVKANTKLKVARK